MPIPTTQTGYQLALLYQGRGHSYPARVLTEAQRARVLEAAEDVLGRALDEWEQYTQWTWAEQVEFHHRILRAVISGRYGVRIVLKTRAVRIYDESEAVQATRSPVEIKLGKRKRIIVYSYVADDHGHGLVALPEPDRQRVVDAAAHIKGRPLRAHEAEAILEWADQIAYEHGWLTHVLEGRAAAHVDSNFVVRVYIPEDARRTDYWKLAPVPFHISDKETRMTRTIALAFTWGMARMFRPLLPASHPWHGSGLPAWDAWKRSATDLNVGVGYAMMLSIIPGLVTLAWLINVA